jgi:hypothetical protein
MQSSPIETSAHGATAHTRGLPKGRVAGTSSTPTLPPVGSDLAGLEAERRRLMQELASLQASRAELDERHARAEQVGDVGCVWPCSCAPPPPCWQVGVVRPLRGAASRAHNTHWQLAQAAHTGSTPRMRCLCPGCSLARQVG